MSETLQRLHREHKERRARMMPAAKVATLPPAAMPVAEPLPDGKEGIILAVVARHYGVTVKAIIGRGRKPRIIRARKEAMWLMREILEMSYPAVGRVFERGHATVVIVTHTMRRRYTTNSVLRNELDHLHRKVLDACGAP